MEALQNALIALGLLSLVLIFCGVWLFYQRQISLSRRCTDRWI